ncbi:MAG: DNA topoisomerase I [Nanoarchaeota archaeon]|nr:DNA topoisomerase I [Nanoarchaeota archaeon]
MSKEKNAKQNKQKSTNIEKSLQDNNLSGEFISEEKKSRSSKLRSVENKKFSGLNTTLIITEKPQAAEKIATALSDAKDEKIMTKDRISFYEFYKNNRRYIVGCAVGHLFGIQQSSQRGPFPNFEVEWKPAYTKKNSAFTKKYLDLLSKLAKESDEFIVATDFDVEGEVIGWNIIRFLCKKNDAKRMKFSSLTKDSLQNSFENLMPHLNWGAAIAGETRHYVDWFYGINLSRGLMKSLSKTGTFRILSIGRVQGPALKIVAERENEIKNFKPEKYWQIFLLVRDIKNQKIEVKYPKDIFNESELLKFAHLKNKKGTAATLISDEKVPAPIPFDLTTLQTECYSHFGLTPSQTLKIAQSLYLEGLISYPRTSSQKYPEGIGYEKIIKNLNKYTTLTKYAINKKPTEGKKEDPAHPAIYPTGEIKKIRESDKKVYDLIVKRFISCFCAEAIVEDKKIIVEINGLKFTANGAKIKERGWMNVYPSSLKEAELPTINGEVDVLEIRTEEKMTQPPRRYSAASLVKELEKRGLGTKATRASIVETLYTRGYVREKSIQVTELGLRLVDTLEKYSPIILDEKLTKEISEELEKIEVAEENLLEKEKKVLDTAKEEIMKIAEDMNKNMDAMGKNLADANALVREQEKESNTMTECPVCHAGKLRVMFGKKFSRYFVSCDAYPECKTIFSLPPRGLMKPARNKTGDLEKCQECGFPLILSFQKGRAPWKFCFNPSCPSNTELQKKKKEFKEKLASGQIEINNGKIIDHTKKNRNPKTALSPIHNISKQSSVKGAANKVTPEISENQLQENPQNTSGEIRHDEVKQSNNKSANKIRQRRVKNSGHGKNTRISKTEDSALSVSNSNSNQENINKGNQNQETKNRKDD